MSDEFGLHEMVHGSPGLREIFCFGCFQRVFIRPNRDQLCPSCGTRVPTQMTEEQARLLGEYADRQIVFGEQMTAEEVLGSDGQELPHGMHAARDMNALRSSNGAPQTVEGQENTANDRAQEEFLRSMFQYLMLQQQEGENQDQGTSQQNGASKRAIESLRRHHIKSQGDVPLQMSLKLESMQGEMVLIPADFGPSVVQSYRDSSSRNHAATSDGQHHIPESSGENTVLKEKRIERESTCVLKGPLVACHPPTAKTLDKDKRMDGAIAFARRGEISFAEKARLVQQQGANALIVQQTFDVWPYTMTDLSTKGEGVNIPLLMVRKETGDSIIEKLQNHNKPLTAAILACSATSRCPITREIFQEDETAIEMPCGHWFSEDGLLYWLDSHNTCPLCRYELEKNADHEKQRAHASDVGSFDDPAGPSGAFAFWYL